MGLTARLDARPSWHGRERIRGEFTLLFEGAGGAAEGAQAGGEEMPGAAAGSRGGGGGDMLARLRGMLAAGESPSRAARAVAEATGLRRRDVYAEALRLSTDTAADPPPGGAAAVAAGVGGNDAGDQPAARAHGGG